MSSSPLADAHRRCRGDGSILVRSSGSEGLRSFPRSPALRRILYLSAEAEAGKNKAPVIVAGTWLDEVSRMNSWWKIDGDWESRCRDSRTECCMIGEGGRRPGSGLIPGQTVKVQYAGREAALRVSAIVVTSGSSEDNQIFVGLPLAQELGGLGTRASLLQNQRAGLGTQEVENVIERLSLALPGSRCAR